MTRTLTLAPEKAQEGRVKVWDLGVRLFHWSLVACFTGAYLSSDDAGAVHHWLGYGALGLVCFRVFWGFAGTHYARFSQFVPGVATFLNYVSAVLHRKEARHTGHNPAAGVMILFLLGMVAGISITGWMMTTDYGWGLEWLEELHEGLVNITLAAVAAHVFAALYESVRHGENLIMSMIDGYKRK
jgi:cytochrome b